eukprot:CAMPEP_0174754084 /NCGR_PEP_ID=MMETSP1094-20130205/105344_1 /TAXON_ID=156173 /ORGANISM="Chrysochromulina brevifilum, Strain UTEX LB 985" /LENGTH=121 /DNA_ID=CAMNT_0015959925 /DNA_START=458 /DNA_END=824 /DNA_ORIENTATION=-
MTKRDPMPSDRPSAPNSSASRSPQRCQKPATPHHREALSRAARPYLRLAAAAEEGRTPLAATPQSHPVAACDARYLTRAAYSPRCPGHRADHHREVGSAQQARWPQHVEPLKPEARYAGDC